MAEIVDGAGALRSIRYKAKLSRGEVAERANVPPSALMRWEHGAGSPRLEHLLRVLSVLNPTPADVELVLNYFSQARRPERPTDVPLQAEKDGERIVRPVSRSERMVAIVPASQSGKPDPSPITTPVELAEALNAVHIWAGAPSLRTLQDASNGVLRRATISDMLNTGKIEETQRIPDLDRCIAFVRLCGIRDTGEWVAAWRRLKARQRPQAGGWLKA